MATGKNKTSCRSPCETVTFCERNCAWRLRIWRFLRDEPVAAFTWALWINSAKSRKRARESDGCMTGHRGDADRGKSWRGRSPGTQTTVVL